jgi:hypothetical protein
MIVLVTSILIVRTAGATAHMILLSVSFSRTRPNGSKRNLANNNNVSKKDRPFSCCTFRKEVNTLACKASKKNDLGLYASALKRQQDKESKAKQAKRRAIESEDSSLSKDSMSVHNLIKPITCRQNIRSPVTKANPKSKLVKKADGKSNNEEMDIVFLSAFKKMQLEDDYDMLDLDDDVLSTSLVLISEEHPWNKIIGLMFVSLMAINQHKKLLNVLLPLFLPLRQKSTPRTSCSGLVVYSRHI